MAATPTTPTTPATPTTPTPPDPLAPTSTGAPAITGTAQQGKTLSTTNGSWSNGPTRFTYSWQTCNASGASCTAISGAASATYTVVAGDAGHTIRSVVTAGNLLGSGQATSAATATVLPAPPIATAAPTVTGTAQQGQSLSTTNGSWSNNPTGYTYAWEDCNTSGLACIAISGATSSSYQLQSTDVGHAIVAVVTASNGGGGGQATSQSVGPVEAAPEPVAPSNTGVPTISGAPVAGQTLTASPGTWSGDTPMTYSYSWSDGTTGQTDTLSSADVGAQVEVTVTAENDGGSGSATSSGVGPVTAASPPSPEFNCAGAAGSAQPNYASMDACGYPSPDTTGVPAGITLSTTGACAAWASGGTVSTANTTIDGCQINGAIVIAANNVTIEDSNISSNSSSGGVRIGSGVTGALVEYDTIHGTNGTASGNLQAAVYNTNYTDSANAVTIDHVDFYDGQRIMHGPGTLTNSFCLNNVAVAGSHYECVYEGGGSMTIDHNTLLTAFTQTAAIYLSTDFEPLGTVKVTNNLLAGGGYALYGGATADGSGVASETVTGNRFSRLYYSDAGYWGTADYMPSSYTWSGDVWDDTGQTVAP